MSSSHHNDSVLCSGADGVYDVSFFGASIGHTIDRSRSVFGKVSGRPYSQLGAEWASLSDVERQAFLLEHHEFAHHALMFSTPAGVLNWRLNQVISRDISWIFQKCSALGIDLPEDEPPRTVLGRPSWQKAVMRRANIDEPIKRYLFHVVASLDDAVLLRRIFFEPGAATTFADLTFGALQDLLNRTYAYLQQRCEVGFVTDWGSRLPRSTSVFPEGKAFNVVDIAEVHAMAAELFVLRALGNIDAMRRRQDRAKDGAFGGAFEIGVAATSAANNLGLSPHQMQVAALIACSSTIDVATQGRRAAYLEEALPWWRFTSNNVFTAAVYGDAVKNCTTLATQGLVGTGSRWLQFHAFPQADESPQEGLEGIHKLSMSLSSLGLDSQIHAIHRGASLNWRYLMTEMATAHPEGSKLEFERVSPESWRGEMQLAVRLVEYSDGIFFREADFDVLYPPNSPLRALESLDRFASPFYQLLGQLLNGALPRVIYAAYAGRLLPRIEILEPKLTALFDDPSAANSMCTLLTNLLEDGMSVDSRRLTFLPKYVNRDRYI